MIKFILFLSICVVSVQPDHNASEVHLKMLCALQPMQMHDGCNMISLHVFCIGLGSSSKLMYYLISTI